MLCELVVLLTFFNLNLNLDLFFNLNLNLDLKLFFNLNLDLDLNLFFNLNLNVNLKLDRMAKLLLLTSYFLPLLCM